MVNNCLQVAESRLLSCHGLNERVLLDVLQGGKMGLCYGDVFLQHKESESWSFEQSKIKETSLSQHAGIGIRKIQKGSIGFAYTEQFDLPALSDTAVLAEPVGMQMGKPSSPVPKALQVSQVLYDAEGAPFSPDAVRALFHRTDQMVRDLDPRVEQCSLHLTRSHEVVWVINHKGHFAADVRPMIRFDIEVIVKDGERRESAHTGGGGRYHYQALVESGRIDFWAKEAVRMALLQLQAVPCPAGVMPVVLAAGWPGILLHEAIGHGLEGDAVRKGLSAFTNRLGDQIASTCCTVVDDGTLPNRRGSLQVDDEGNPSQRTVLVDSGVLSHYMVDAYSAQCMGVEPTGNGRRESYAHLPLTRMTNTYMLPGKDRAEDIIASCDQGIYAVHFSGGQVDIASGKFVFSADEAYRIEGGQLQEPIKGATLIGDGASVLQSISMVGSDLALDEGVGVCGKEGQMVPVGVGQPTVKIEQLTVGGTSLASD